MKAVVINYTGKKAKVGNLAFDTGRLGIFVGYCGNCKAKIIMDLEEARAFADRYQHQQNKIRTKMIIKRLEEIS